MLPFSGNSRATLVRLFAFRRQARAFRVRRHLLGEHFARRRFRGDAPLRFHEPGTLRVAPLCRFRGRQLLGMLALLRKAGRLGFRRRLLFGSDARGRFAFGAFGRFGRGCLVVRRPRLGFRQARLFGIAPPRRLAGGLLLGLPALRRKANRLGFRRRLLFRGDARRGFHFGALFRLGRGGFLVRQPVLRLRQAGALDVPALGRFVRGLFLGLPAPFRQARRLGFRDRLAFGREARLRFRLRAPQRFPHRGFLDRVGGDERRSGRGRGLRRPCRRPGVARAPLGEDALALGFGL